MENTKMFHESFRDTFFIFYYNFTKSVMLHNTFMWVNRTCKSYFNIKETIVFLRSIFVFKRPLRLGRQNKPRVVTKRDMLLLIHTTVILFIVNLKKSSNCHTCHVDFFFKRVSKVFIGWKCWSIVSLDHSAGERGWMVVYRCYRSHVRRERSPNKKKKTFFLQIMTMLRRWNVDSKRRGKEIKDRNVNHSIRGTKRLRKIMTVDKNPYSLNCIWNETLEFPV